jgi:hypothetical protein
MADPRFKASALVYVHHKDFVQFLGIATFFDGATKFSITTLSKLSLRIIYLIVTHSAL